MAYSNLSVNTRQINKFKLAQNIKIIFVFLFVAAIGVGSWFLYDYYQKEVSKINNNGKEVSLASSTISATNKGVNNDKSDVISLDRSFSASQNLTNEIPDEVIEAINSIEFSGFKNNSYVSSSFRGEFESEDAKITFNRSTWSYTNSNAGTIRATVNNNGQIVILNVSFEKDNGSWRAVDYSLI